MPTLHPELKSATSPRELERAFLERHVCESRPSLALGWQLTVASRAVVLPDPANPVLLFVSRSAAGPR